MLRLISAIRKSQKMNSVYPNGAQCSSIGGPKTTMGRMLILASLLCCLLAMPLPIAPVRSPQSLAILQARDRCFRSEKINSSQRLALDKQQYKNVPAVHRYVYCFWTRLQVWQDGSGFDAMRIVERFGGPRRLNPEKAIPIINGCNNNARRNSKTTLDWCYGAFDCVLRTSVGEWYRRYMQDVINGNA